jgi:hypothetical protein
MATVWLPAVVGESVSVLAVQQKNDSLSRAVLGAGYPRLKSIGGRRRHSTAGGKSVKE